MEPIKPINVSLFVFDTPDRFEKTISYIAEEGITIKRMIQVNSLTDFKDKLKELDANDYIALVVHVFAEDDFVGIKTFLKYKFSKSFPKLRIMYVTSADITKEDLMSKGVRSELLLNNDINIYKYFDVLDKIENDGERKFVHTKKELLTDSKPNKSSEYPHFDYAIITALYEDEFEEVQKLFDFEDNIKTGTTIYKIGKLKNTEIKVVACFATKTGMVEASIIATEMINLFNPKYIFMPGVCGGSDKTGFGNVIVAEKVFMFQKGKVSDLREETENGNQITKLYYCDSEFDKNKVTDSTGKKIKLIVEKFESESEVIDIDTELVTLIKPELKTIEDKINEPYKVDTEKIKVQLEPMACSMMVINKEDYFDESILPIDRKTKAVEMESYGVARASKIANGGKTKFLIFKSVMDKAKLKDDKYKKKAAYTSAQFLKHLLIDGILK